VMKYERETVISEMQILQLMWIGVQSGEDRRTEFRRMIYHPNTFLEKMYPIGNGVNGCREAGIKRSAGWESPLRTKVTVASVVAKRPAGHLLLLHSVIALRWYVAVGRKERLLHVHCFLSEGYHL